MERSSLQGEKPHLKGEGSHLDLDPAEFGTNPNEPRVSPRFISINSCCRCAGGADSSLMLTAAGAPRSERGSRSMSDAPPEGNQGV